MHSAMIALIVFMVGSYGMGRFVLWHMRVSLPGPLENSVYSIGIGLGVWCYALFLLGHAGLLYPWLLMSLALLSALPAFAWIVRDAVRSPFRFSKINLTLLTRGRSVRACHSVHHLTMLFFSGDRRYFKRRNRDTSLRSKKLASAS